MDDTKPTVFISYSHWDEEWKDRLRPHLEAMENLDRIVIWDDRDIGAGEKWYPKIREAIERASVGICLISANLLASKFCTKEEIPYLLGQEGVLFLPVLIKPCEWEIHHWLSPIQMLPRNGKSVLVDFKDQEDVAFTEVAKRIRRYLEDRAPIPPTTAPSWETLHEDSVDISRLPYTGKALFGRTDKYKLLNNAWASDATNVVSLVAWGGVGKSTLLNKWLERMTADNYRGAQRVYAWSFYSQGTGQRVTSADQFINAALLWFGEPNPTAIKSPWDKGKRLAELVQQERTLLILDGMEPLQSGYDFERGKIKDPAVATLVRQLAQGQGQGGLCVISTREHVADLEGYPKTTLEKNLEQVSPEAGRALLNVRGVVGTDAEKEEASRAFGNHALAINLLALYLHGIEGHHVSHAASIPDIDVPEAKGKHPRRVMAAFEARFDEGPDVELLRVLGLFDRPARTGEIDAVVAAPAIPDLTQHLEPLSERGFARVVDKLRTIGLIAQRSTHQPDVLDTHPLVREHFAEQVQEQFPEAWREGNNRLYKYLKEKTTPRPDTLEEMMPLFQAVAHGCQAGRHQEALNEVYRRRMHREETLGDGTSYNQYTLGAISADLAAVSWFFDDDIPNQPWCQPVGGLTEVAKGFVLNEAGWDLRSLGLLAEGVQPMQKALEVRSNTEDWIGAAGSAANLSVLHVLLGELPQALIYAKEGVRLAETAKSCGDVEGPWGPMYSYNRAFLGEVLHKMKQMDEAEIVFREAEGIQEEWDPEHPLLYESMAGFLYCDFLLDQGKYLDVKKRATRTLEWNKNEGRLRDVALDRLSLGRAHFLEAVDKDTGDFSKATDHLEHAVGGLRQAGTQEFLVLGLLARAALRRVQKKVSEAWADVQGAMEIAELGSIRLYKADAYLESARLFVDEGNRDKAREYLNRAKMMIDEMGYHRRDREVQVLEKVLVRGER